MGRVGQTPSAHVTRLANAQTLTGRIRPLGNFNLTAARRQRHVEIRQKIAQELRGISLLEETGQATTTAVELTVNNYTGSARPYLVSYNAVVDALVYYEITEVDPIMHRTGGYPPKVAVTTKLGEMLVRQETLIVWR